MSLNQKTIIAALKALHIKGLPKNVVDLNMLTATEIDDNDITINLALRAPHSNNPDAISIPVKQCLQALEGAETVTVNVHKVSSTKTETKTSAPSTDNTLLKGVKNIIGIASGKGGVGKSTVTANLAMTLALAGKKVGIMDADIYGPSMSLMFNITEAPHVQEDRSVTPVSVVGGIKVLSMAMFAESDKAVIWRGPMASQMIQNFISRCHWGELDYLLIDMPPGTGDIHLTLTQNCPMNGAVVVTTPQNMSIIDARKGLQMFETVNVPVLGIIENMSYFQTPDGTRHHIFRSGGGERMAESVGVPFLGEIPMDPAVADGGDFGKPVSYTNPNHVVSKAFSQLAEDVITQLEEALAIQSDLSQFDVAWTDLPQEEF